MESRVSMAPPISAATTVSEFSSLPFYERFPESAIRFNCFLFLVPSAPA